ncbi:MAG: ribbon-helix-helix protein, CopG family [Anaerolineales bacterium]|nr:ribbon-helix-helix protein, CopG family [Anaerolineales bacterium]
MRITIQLDDELLAEIKLYAARSGKTMTVVIEDSLRAVLAHQR